MPTAPPRPHHPSAATLATRLAAALVSAALLAGQAAAFDMRDCRIDRVVFVDAWSLAEFRTERIGLDAYYACGPDQIFQDNPEGRSDCSRPYGDLVLQGTYIEYGDSTPFTAVYSFHKSTSPCCGWSVFPTEEAAEIEAGTTWLKPDDMPVLRDWPIGGITNAWGSTDAMDGLVALICQPDIS